MQPVELQWSRDACVYNFDGLWNLFQSTPNTNSADIWNISKWTSKARECAPTWSLYSVTSMEATL